MKTCGTCAHWSVWAEEAHLFDVIGKCSIGGPPPRDGCSDCRRTETCGDHKPKEQK